MRYIPALIWIALLAFVLTRHIKVYRLYDNQLTLVRKIEEAGGIEDGSTLVAVNQRVRYAVRICLATAGIIIGFGALYAVYNDSFGQGLLFGLSVLSYFYLSEAATGYLTIRDERVIGSILKIDDDQRSADLRANTEATDRNTAAMTRTSDADDARDVRDAATLKANTDATQTNTDAVTKNTESRDAGVVVKANTDATHGNTDAVTKNTEAQGGS